MTLCLNSALSTHETSRRKQKRLLLRPPSETVASALAKIGVNDPTLESMAITGHRGHMCCAPTKADNSSLHSIYELLLRVGAHKDSPEHGALIMFI